MTNGQTHSFYKGRVYDILRLKSDLFPMDIIYCNKLADIFILLFGSEISTVDEKHRLI